MLVPGLLFDAGVFCLIYRISSHFDPGLILYPVTFAEVQPFDVERRGKFRHLSL
jgi:hypothetical protein